MFDFLSFPFGQRAALELVLLSIAAGTLGPWVVLRGLAFFAHGAAAVTVPGLVLAAGLSVASPIGAALFAFGFSAFVAGASRTDDSRDAAVALSLVASVAIGVILASDVFPDSANVQSLLFGSLLAISTTDIVIAGAVSVIAVVLNLVLGQRWLATGLDSSTGVTGMRGADLVLLAAIAALAVALLSALGALLASALIVIPAATVRIWTNRLPRWQGATAIYAIAIALIGLELSFRFDTPPGATIAAIAAAGFLLSVTAAWVRGMPKGRAARPALVSSSIAALLAFGLSGCGDSSKTSSSDGPKVIASTTQLADIARNVAGQSASVTQLLKANSDAHDFEPRPSDVAAVGTAKLVLSSGDGLDSWVADLVKQSGADVSSLDVGSKLTSKLEGEEHHHEGETAEEHAEHADEHSAADHSVDPHWWHDPQNVAAAINPIRDALLKAVPASSRTAVKANAAAYKKKIQTLDSEVAQCFAEVPASDRKLVTSHDAFGYFVRRYKITVVGSVIPSQSTLAQPSAGDLSKLQASIRREKVKAIFPESSINRKLAEQIAKATGARADLSLYGDSLGPAGSDGATYIGMIKHNASAMIQGFTGRPEGCKFSV